LQGESVSARELPYEAVTFGPGEPSDGAIFGWFHPPLGSPRSTGVVICSPIGDDYLRAHRALRQLAVDLAGAGFAVLRFDFRGTGDSSGSERDPGVAAAWIEDIQLAIAELRSRSGVEEIGLVGLRLGATLAMHVAALGDRTVDSLVLWNPFPSGDAYVNEATKLHRMHMMLEPEGFASVPRDWSVGGQEALGFLLTPDTIATLSKVDLFASDERPARRALVVGMSNVPAEEKLLAHLKGLGVETDYAHFPGHKFLMLAPAKASLPMPPLQEIVRWLSAKHPPTNAPRAAVPRAATAVHRGEQPLVFGRDHALFGVLVHPPKDRRDPKRPAIILANAGAIHRVGPHRFYVPMARRWASLGFWVLRMDLSGLGDSPAAPGCEENLSYPRDGLADIAEAMFALEQVTGARRFIVAGHCSGGDLAFKIGLQDPRVAGAMMLNPRTFCVNDLGKIEEYKRARYYQDALTRNSSWKKALRGDVDFGRALGMLAPKIVDQIKHRARSLTGGGAHIDDASNVPAGLRLLAERGVDTFLVATARDPGIDYLDMRDGKAMAALASVPGFRRQDFPGTDHTFTSLYSQERLSQVLTDHLSAHHYS
jgi:alpha-beta hydrolase superfamily lysophospholipase